MEKNPPLTRLGRRTCKNCGNKTPFWYVTCPKCNEPLDANNSCTTFSKKGKIIRIVTRINQHIETFRLFNKVILYYSTDNAISWKEVQMKPKKELYFAELMDIPQGANITYYIEANDISGKKVIEDNGGNFFTYNLER
ncbi:MAG: hypothetical protein ACTSUE_11315 [Promethearchaeota archaeon]